MSGWRVVVVAALACIFLPSIRGRWWDYSTILLKQLCTLPQYNAPSMTVVPGPNAVVVGIAERKVKRIR